MSGNEVPGKKKTLLSASQLRASDENFDLYCIPCADDKNKHVEAGGYCVDCREYLCRECVDFHKNFRLTKKHVIQDKDAMPRDAKQVQSPQQTKDECTELCKKHPGKILEYYCKPHNELGCSVCVTLGHITCGVGYIPELSKGIANSDEYIQLSTKMNRLQKNFIKTKETCKESIHEAENKSKMYTDKVTTLGDNIIDHIRDLVKIALDEKDEFVKEMLVGLKKSQIQSEKINEEICTMQEDLKSKKDSENQSFVLMKMFQMNVKEVEAKLAEAQMDAKVTVFKFAENPGMKSVKEIETLGKVFTYKKIKKQTENINISTEKDELTPHITGLEIMYDRRIAMADYNNKSIKLVDTKDSIVSEIKLQHEPWDISEVKKGQLVVTCPKNGKIQFMSVTDKLTLGHALNIERQCHGIAAHQDTLIVSFLSLNFKVLVLDMNGKVLRRITTGEDGKGLFCHPWYVAVNPNNNMIYVSDSTKGTVTFITLEGEVKAIYSTDSPRSLCVGEAGSVYVCGPSGLQHISGNGTKIQKLLNPGQDGAFFWSVADDTNTGRLYLGSSFEKYLRVYQLQ